MHVLTLVLMLLTLPLGLSSRDFKVRSYSFRAFRSLKDCVDTRPWLVWALFRAPDAQAVKSLQELYQDYETLEHPAGTYPHIYAFFNYDEGAYPFYHRAGNLVEFWRPYDFEACSWEKLKNEIHTQASIDFVDSLFKKGWTRGKVRAFLERAGKDTREPPMSYVP